MIHVMSSVDPAAFFREMLGHWENMANQFGNELMKSGEFARTMHGATAAGLKAQEAAREAMGRALAAANMPSREEVFDLSARMKAVEDRLARIEALLSQIAGVPAAAPARPKPARTRKPPKSAA
jgi:hypothetical protein